MARSIASARLDSSQLTSWEQAVNRQLALSILDRRAIGYALARGTCERGSDWAGGAPTRQDDHFKGHLVEVLLFCLRATLSNGTGLHLRICEPSRPKALSTTPGIDLLEVGETGSGYYFQLWECKGTDGGVATPLRQAAAQLCDEDDTAYQGFMEAYRCIQDSPALAQDTALSQFVHDMPGIFYDPTPQAQKKIGAVVGTGAHCTAEDARSFPRRVATSVAGMASACHVMLIRIQDFPRFREDVFQRLWHIF